MKKKVVFMLIAIMLFAGQNAFAGTSDSLALNQEQVALVTDTSSNGAAIIAPAGDTTGKLKEVARGVVDSLIGDVKTFVKPKPLSFRSIAIPVGMIGVGTLIAFSPKLQKANLFVRDELYVDRKNQAQFHLDNYTLFAPAVAVYALNLAGLKGKNNFVDRSVMYVMSNAIANGLVFSTKKLAGVTRPDSSDHYSFPSGHTAEAFVSAEFMRQEYKDVSPWIGVAGYTAAIATGVLRIYNNKHWLNDVVVGAGIGVLSVRLSYWLYPVLKNTILQKTGGRTKTMVMPTYQNGAFGVGMVTNF